MMSAPPSLELGSDIEIAERVWAWLKRDFGEVPYCEGEVWRYTGTHWEAISEDEMRRRVHAFDGASCGSKKVRLNQGRINSILHELGAMCSEPSFFEKRPLGINCLSGFIQFDGTGTPKLVPHSPDQRQRHVLSGKWTVGSPGDLLEGSLLSRLLHGSFKGDPDAAEKIALIAEIAGAAALGHGTRHIAPKAAVLLGRTAENGKSQVLAVLRGLLPPSAVSSIPPSKFGDERYAVRLRGKMLNTSDELGSAKAIASDGFKSIVTGEPVTARDLYKSAVDFRPEAQHVFACNQLPSFQGGMDRGVIRRLLPIAFNRTIPEGERVPHIGERLAREELDLVLAWAVDGASRLLKRGYFPDLKSSSEALAEWAQTSDPVLGWLEERVMPGLTVVGAEPPRVSTSTAYSDFKFWAACQGYSENSLPKVNQFSQRVTAGGASRCITYKHSGKFRGFVGMRLRPLTGDNAIPQTKDAA